MLTIDDAIEKLTAIKKIHGNIEIGIPIYSNGTVRPFSFYATVDPRPINSKIVTIT